MFSIRDLAFVSTSALIDSEMEVLFFAGRLFPDFLGFSIPHLSYRRTGVG
jgi:hypothetical protein